MIFNGYNKQKYLFVVVVVFFFFVFYQYSMTRLKKLNILLSHAEVSVYNLLQPLLLYVFGADVNKIDNQDHLKK